MNAENDFTIYRHSSKLEKLSSIYDKTSIFFLQFLFKIYIGLELEQMIQGNGLLII